MELNNIETNNLTKKKTIGIILNIAIGICVFVAFMISAATDLRGTYLGQDVQITFQPDGSKAAPYLIFLVLALALSISKFAICHQQLDKTKPMSVARLVFQILFVISVVFSCVSLAILGTVTTEQSLSGIDAIATAPLIGCSISIAVYIAKVITEVLELKK